MPGDMVGTCKATRKEDGMAESTFQTIPMLRIFDVGKAKEFYVDFLGLHVDWEHRFDANAPIYMQVSRDNLILHLTEHHGDCCPGSSVFVRLTNLDQLHQELIAKSYTYMRPRVEIAPWNAKVMEIIDPFGNRLRFNEDRKDETSYI
ncbi:MAG TPA: glyoxalase superfamily protein [Nitrospiraceae bacterium]|nr:glyoxalase superfamily protein [Nitrospiraceae bacterium]